MYFFAMIRLFMCLGLASAYDLWEKSLKVRFDINPFGIGTTSFIKLPQSTKEAFNEGWEMVIRPEGPPGYSSLVMWCPRNDYTICVLFDDTGYVAGLQIALENSRFSSAFDMKTQGFTDWTIAVDGKTKTFSTIQQYYVSAATLTNDPTTRIATRDPKLLLQDGDLYVSGFRGDLYNISTTVKHFTKHSIYKKQACIPWMGLHYYYNMTPTTPCQADTLFPWFPLVHSNLLIGVGFAVFGEYTLDPTPQYFENPGKLAAKLIIPRGPECLYNLTESAGLVTLHTYFIKDPQLIICL